MSRCMFGVLAERNRWQGGLVCVSPSLVIMTKPPQCEHLLNATHTLLEQSEKTGKCANCSVPLQQLSRHNALFLVFIYFLVYFFLI